MRAGASFIPGAAGRIPRVAELIPGPAGVMHGAAGVSPGAAGCIPGDAGFSLASASGFYLFARCAFNQKHTMSTAMSSIWPASKA